MDGMDGMDVMDPEGEALHPMRAPDVQVRLLSPFAFLLSRFGRSPKRATSHGWRSLRSAGGLMDGMDGMDLMDPEGEALHLLRKA
jgi:hypothetical protein